MATCFRRRPSSTTMVVVAGRPHVFLACVAFLLHLCLTSAAVSTATLLGYDCVDNRHASSAAASAAFPAAPPLLSRDHAVLCGVHTHLVVRAAIPVPANVSLASAALPPVALTAKSPSCTFQAAGSGADAELRLPVVAARVSALTAAQWTVDAALAFPADANDEEEDYSWTQRQQLRAGGSSGGVGGTSLACAFRVADEPPDVNVDLALAPLTFLGGDFELTGATLLNKPDPSSANTNAATVAPRSARTTPSSSSPSAAPAPRRALATVATVATPLLGIGKTALFRLEVSGANAAARAASLRGSCVVNQQNVTVVAGHFNYTVQQLDSDLVGLTYSCAVEDGAGNAPHKDSASGVIKHLVLQLDGSIPKIEDDIFMLFSTDKPARIGSTVSLTVKAENLTQGYSGMCDVNGVKGVPLLEAEDHGFYMIQYTVAEGDASRDDASTMPLSCVVQNRAGNTYLFQYAVELGFGIDAVRPRVKSTVLLFSSDRPAHEGTIIEIQVTFEDEEPHLRVARNESCLVNNVSVGASFSKSSAHAFLLTYVVGKGEAMWKAGALPVRCVVQDAAGNPAVIDRFTDGNTLMARELKPIEIDADEVLATEFLPDRLLIISFAIVAIASHSISNVCPHLGLPRITGYIVTGILVGPYVLNFLSTPQIRQLRIIDELSMAYIGLTAGSKLHWNHMQPIMKSILSVTVGLTLVEYIIGTLTITVLAGYIDFLQDTTESEKYAIALLAGCMMIARSPSSALAVIEETKSQGHFTTLVFAVTVMCDVLVIFLFNVNSMITESFLSEKNMSRGDLLRLVLQLCGSTLLGAVLGKLMGCVVFWRPRAIKRKSVWFKAQQISKQLLILLYGWMIFVVCHLAHPYLEPLLCCMVSGAVMWNTSANPEELGVLLKNLADLVYVSFFTITGATLELDMLAKAMALSLVLCLTRVMGIFLGSFVGGVVAGEDRGHCKVAWMAYITQAGVTLGLAKQIQLMYPGWGSYFSTMIVAVVICNQLLGPPLLRYVLRLVGDAKKKEIGKVDGLTALVFTGADTQNAQSAILRLEVCGWNVHSLEVQSSLEAKKEKAYVEAVTKDVHDLIKAVKPIEVVVIMMPTDEENYEVIRAVTHACQKLRRLRVLRVVVQVAGNSSSTSSNADDECTTRWAAKFADMPVVLEYGDTIDVVVVDRVEATDMLIELAACGKVVNITEKQPTTAIAMEDSETDLESDAAGRVPSRVRLRQTLKHTVRRMMLV